MYTKSSIGLGTYPYVNARVRVMKSTMIQRDEYQKLIKMSPDEITKFIGETAYKKEIDELAMKFNGVDLIEAALNLNASRSFNKLIKISSKEVRTLIEEYLGQYDVYNLKTILRGKFCGKASDEIKRLLIPAGHLDMDALDALVKMETIKEVLAASKILKMDKKTMDAIDEYEKTKSLMDIENIIDKGYYNSLMELSLKIPKNGKYIRNFIKTEIDILNIRLLFRLIREKMQKKDIREKLVFSGEKLKRDKLLKLADSKDIDELYSGLSGTGYDKVIADCMDDVKKNEFGCLEIVLEKHYLKKAYLMMHQNPLSVGPIIGYMVGKDIEIRNLKMLARAKVVGLDEKFMNDSLVI
ncbi:MAG: ATP synthase A1 subunit C [archaeon]